MEYYINVEPNVYIYVEDINPTGRKTILFIHGWPGNHNLFEYQYDQLPKQGYRCIGLDLRGFGQSSRPWSGYSYNRLADDVRAVVDELQLRDFTLGGHSTGGGIRGIKAGTLCGSSTQLGSAAEFSVRTAGAGCAQYYPRYI